MATHNNDPPTKRRKLNAQAEATLATGLDRPISPPPPGRKALVVPEAAIKPTWSFAALQQPATSTLPDELAKQDVVPAAERNSLEKNEAKFVPSPMQLTSIRDLKLYQNVDSVGLGELLGNPLIRSCVVFNYLHDIDYVM